MLTITMFVKMHKGSSTIFMMCMVLAKYIFC